MVMQFRLEVMNLLMLWVVSDNLMNLGIVLFFARRGWRAIHRTGCRTTLSARTDATLIADTVRRYFFYTTLKTAICGTFYL